jgi:hypothetical protein
MVILLTLRPGRHLRIEVINKADDNRASGLIPEPEKSIPGACRPAADYPGATSAVSLGLSLDNRPAAYRVRPSLSAPL